MAKILGPDGQPISTETLSEPQTSHYSHLQRELQTHPTRGLTPSKLASILDQAEQGDLQAQFDLYEDMEEKDGHIAAELGKRRRALLVNCSVVPRKNPTAQETAAAELLTELVGEIPDFEDVLFDITDAIGKGFSCCEIEWHRPEKYWIPKTITHRPQSWFTVHRGYRQELRLRSNTTVDGIVGEPLRPFGWITHVHKAKSGYPLSDDQIRRVAALVHGMVQTVLQERHCGHDLPLGVRLTVQDRLEGMAPDWPESPAAVALRELQQAWGGKLPEDSAELFAALLAMGPGELVKLLAVCVASTVDVVTPRAARQQPGVELAQAVGLDMAAWWKPTAEGYFKHVSKAVILDAVGEFAPDQVNRLGKLKKADIASEAERLADGTCWMPVIFKAEGVAQEECQHGTADESDAIEDEAQMA